MVNWCIQSLKTLAIIGVFPSTMHTAWAQGDLFALWPDSTLSQANSALHVDYMSDEEKEAVFYINLVRINPKLFADTYLEDFLEREDMKKDREIKDLIKELQNTPSMNPLAPNAALTEFARNHAIDMGTSGRTGHNSSSGNSFRQRIEPLTTKFSSVNENCNYGNESGDAAVIDLLIDRNVPNLGHRRNILDPEMQFIGMAIEPHKRWRFNCVQDFGAKDN